MDYIFRWLNLRFLSGEQLTLFAGLAPRGAATAGLADNSSGKRTGGGDGTAQSGQAAEAVADRLRQMSGHGSGPSAGGGIAPEAQSWTGRRAARRTCPT